MPMVNHMLISKWLRLICSALRDYTIQNEHVDLVESSSPIKKKCVFSSE
jgi:hypothetical protein